MPPLLPPNGHNCLSSKNTHLYVDLFMASIAPGGMWTGSWQGAVYRGKDQSYITAPFFNNASFITVLISLFHGHSPQLACVPANTLAIASQEGRIDVRVFLDISLLEYRLA